MRFSIVIALASAAWAAGELPRISVYATAGDVSRYLSTSETRNRTAAALRSLGITHVIAEGRRGDEYVRPETLREVRTQLAALGFSVSGGIATVPGKTFGQRQQGGLTWLDWESRATRAGVTDFFRENAPVFDELVIDDFYCTGDESQAAERARAGRDWGEYRRNLLVSLMRPLVVEPARAANPNVRLILKFPQWYDRFHLFGYDPVRMPPSFERIWVGTEVRNPRTRRMGYVQPTEGYINFRWLSNVIGAEKVDGAWFDHIECTAQNFVDQAYQSVLAGARELILFHLGDIVEGHEGHALFRRALPELRDTAGRIQGRQAEGVAFYKPPDSDPGENRYAMDYLAMIGLPLVPVARYPETSSAAILGLQAAADPALAGKVKAHLRRGARVAMSAELIGKVGRVEGAIPVDLRTFSEQDYRDAGEYLLAPKEVPWVDMTRAEADSLRRKLGVDLSAPTRIAYYQFGSLRALYSFRDDDVDVVAGRDKVRVPAHSLTWIPTRRD